MAQRNSFTDMKAEQQRMTASWKAEGRQSEAWTVADPEVVEIFSAGIAFGLKVARRKDREPLYSPNEWRKALREAIERAAALERRLDEAKNGMVKK